MRVRCVMGVGAMATMVLTMAVQADEGAIGYRQKVMDAVGGTMQSMVAIAKQQVPHGAHLAVHARNMAGLATIVPDVFPAGSGEGADTDALPKIWAEPDAFKERLTAFVDAAKNLDTVVASGDMSGFGDALGKLGQSCKGCHDDFKAE